MNRNKTVTPWMKDSMMDFSNKDCFPPAAHVLTKCLNCGGEANGILYHCRDCDDSLCQTCVTAHRRFRITKDHIIGRIDNHSSSMSSSMSSLFSFNSNETLDEIGTARNNFHNSSLAADKIWRINKENRQNIISELTPALLHEHVSGDLTSQIQLDSVEKNLGSFYNKWTSAKTDVRALMQMYRMRVDEREKELLNELTASVAVRTASLKREMETYQAIQASYARSMRILDSVLKNGRPFDILRAKAMCDSEIQKAKELQESALFPEEKIVFVPPSDDVLRGLRQMGKIIIDESKISPSPIQKNSGIDRTKFARPKVNLLANSVSPTVDDKPSACVPDGGIRNGAGNRVPSPPKTKLNAWARPIKFTDEQKPFRAVIPQPVSNPKVQPVKALCPGKFDYKLAGQPKIIIGRDGSEDGELSRPWGVCCTNEGNIIVADRSNHRIQIFSPEGKFLSKFGQFGKEGPGFFDRPAGVSVDPRGRIFITDKDNHRIQVFSQEGEFVFMFGKEGRQNGHFHYPWDIAVNSVGHVAVSDTRNQRIQLFSNNGTFLRKFGIENVFYQSNNFDSPRGISFNTEGNVVATDFNNHRLLVIDSNFKKAKFLGGPGSGPKQFMRPQGVAVDKQGRIAVADSRNNRIQIINEDGTYVWQFGCGGTDPGQLDRPCGVCFTPDGKVVVVDFGNNRVQIF